jgi:hypothetical protein
MLRLNPTKRYTAMEAYHHPALRLAAPDVIITPRFVRAAAAFDEPEPLPAPMPAPLPARIEAEIQAQALAQAEAQGHVQVERVKGKSKKKRDTAVNGGRSTPLPLGESIKQHTANKGGEVPSPKKGSKLVIKKMRSVEGLAADEEDPTRGYHLIATRMRVSRVLKDSDQDPQARPASPHGPAQRR